MDKFDALEERVDQLLGKLKTLEAENLDLRRALEEERAARETAGARIDNLLIKIQGEINQS